MYVISEFLHDKIIAKQTIIQLSRIVRNMLFLAYVMHKYMSM